MGFINDFYCNRLDPQRRCTLPDVEVMRRSRELSDKEAELLGILPEEERKLFEEIRDAWQDILADNSMDRFIMGFRCGARFAYDTFVGDGATSSEQRKGE